MTSDTQGQARTSSGSTRRVPLALALLAASLPMFMATLDNLVMTNALPVIRTDLGASVEQLQWFVNAYTLSFATLMLGASTLGDRLGRRRVFVAGISIFALASIASALASTPAQLIAARALQGVGGAAILPLSLTLLAAAVPPARRAMAIGVWGGVAGLGVALGPLIGGAVVDGVSWQAIFWINVPIAIFAVPFILRCLPESYGRREPLDVLGLALVGAGVFIGVWGITRATSTAGRRPAWSSRWSPRRSCWSAFVVRESRAPHPLVPLRLFRSRSFSIAQHRRVRVLDSACSGPSSCSPSTCRSWTATPRSRPACAPCPGRRRP